MGKDPRGRGRGGPSRGMTGRPECCAGNVERPLASTEGVWGNPAASKFPVDLHDGTQQKELAQAWNFAHRVSVVNRAIGGM